MNKLHKFRATSSDTSLLDTVAKSRTKRTPRRLNKLCKSDLTKSETFLQEIYNNDLYDDNGYKYRIRDRIASTIGSEVHSVDDKKIVKIPLNMVKKRSIRNFSSELSILKEMNSPRIIRYFGTVSNNLESNIQVGILLEKCINGDLHKYLSNLRDDSIIDKNIVKEWSNNIFSAIRYIHNKNVVHRDIKSPNFLVGDNLKLKLTDFGLAREESNENKNSTLKKLRTSSYWTASELLINENSIYTKSSDVYAGTVVLWEIFNFYYHKKYSKPLKYNNMYAIMGKIMSGERPEISEKFTKDCKELLEEGWHEDPDNRPNVNSMLEKINVIKIYNIFCVSRVVS